MGRPFVGQSVIRREGRAKVLGQAMYVDDLTLPNMLYGATVRSHCPHGRIRDITFGEDIPWDEFTIVTAKDIPGKNVVALIESDQPYLADDIVNHAEEPILLLAHPDRYLLEKARRRITVTIDPLPPILTIDEALAQGKIFKSFVIEHGTIDPVWAKAPLIVEGEYSTGAQEQLYIEPQGMIAWCSPSEGVTVQGSLQCPYYIHKALVGLFGLPENKIRVIQTETGGGFGGKEEYPSILAGHAALLAWKSGRPVKIIYDRAEDMAATTKRHPSRTRIRTAVDRDGTLLGLEIDFTLDGGAYATLSSVVLSRGTLHACGPYRCPHVRVRSRAVATNTPPHGAFRGFGAPQSLFAIERHMDRVAKAVGLAPEAVRRRNFLKDGDTMATGQIIRDGVDLAALMDEALAATRYHEKTTAFAAHNGSHPIKKGIGMAAFLHGAGFTGSGEKYLASVVTVEATADGIVRVLTSSTEMGQGKNTVFAQIAADALGLPVERIDVVIPDTQVVPNSGPTVASRTTMVVGGLVSQAATALKQVLIDADCLAPHAAPEGFAPACARYLQTHESLRVTKRYEQPPDITWDGTRYHGDGYGTYAWAVYIAEVSVDTRTYEVTVDHFHAAQEIGKVINPVLAAGQIEGGVAQGIGYALFEKVCWKNGRMANHQMTNYIMPTAADVPPIAVTFAEVPYRHSPTGAKGIGELPMDGPGPAICNAMTQALGVPIDHIPCLPEDVMVAMEASHATD